MHPADAMHVLVDGVGDAQGRAQANNPHDRRQALIYAAAVSHAPLNAAEQRRRGRTIAAAAASPVCCRADVAEGLRRALSNSIAAPPSPQTLWVVLI